jgi:hypothetical protein
MRNIEGQIAHDEVYFFIFFIPLQVTWYALLVSPDESFPGKGNQHSKDERIAELERQNRRLGAQKAILKKASRIFVEEEQT